MRSGLRACTPALLLLLLAGAAFAPVARNGFINLDDEGEITTNPQVVRGLGVQTLLWALSTTEHGNWYPLTRLSHLADVSLVGLRPGAHHLVSLAWHAGAALLLFAALHAMTGARWRSFVVAALFAVHPLQVESVAWASERKSVLSGFFFALALLLWTRYARRPGPGRYLAALSAGALGLAAKPALMTLPAALLLLEFWPLGRMRTPGQGGAAWSGSQAVRRLLEQAPLLLLAAGSGAVTLFAHRQFGALAMLEPYPLPVRLGNAGLSAAQYLGDLFLPAGLAVFYPHPGSALPWGTAAAACALCAALTVLALGAPRRRPWLAVGWLWFLGTLAPVIGVMQFALHARADRYVYLPIVGIALALVWSAGAVPPPRRFRPVPAAPAAAALAAFAALTAKQTGLWRDSLTLFSHAVAVTSRNWSAEYNLALALDEAGRKPEAVESYAAALRDCPYDKSLIWMAFLKHGNALFGLRRYEEAAGAYRDLVRHSPDKADAYYNLGNAYQALGRREEAVVAFRAAVRARPDYAQAFNNLGNPLAALGRLGEAAEAYGEAVRLAPADPVARENLGRALVMLGRGGEGTAHLREAERLRAAAPDAPGAEADRAREPGLPGR